VTTLAGLVGSSGTTDGTGSDARFWSTWGVTVDSAGNVYVGDGQTVRRVFAANGAPVIFTSGSSIGFSGGQFGFNVAGPGGQLVVIDASADLSSWLPIVTNTFGAGALSLQRPAERRLLQSLLPCPSAVSHLPLGRKFSCAIVEMNLKNCLMVQLMEDALPVTSRPIAAGRR